jgi:hypothetical protein
VPATVVASDTSRAGRIAPTPQPCLVPRAARDRATSTASTNRGSSSVESRSQLVNGAVVRSVDPTAPRSAVTQNPFT